MLRAVQTPYLLVLDVLTPAECVEIIEDLRPLRTVPAHASDGPTITPLREEFERDPQGPAARPTTAMRETLMFASSEFFHLDEPVMPFWGALRYQPGSQREWHRDDSHGPGATWIGAVLYLSQPGVDYEGGELEVAGTDGLLQPPQGSAVFLAGDVLHRVHEVTAGERWVVVGFANGLP